MGSQVHRLLTVALLALAVGSVAGVAAADAGATNHTNATTADIGPSNHTNVTASGVGPSNHGHTPPGTDASLASGRGHWAGQTLAFQAPRSDANERYELYTTTEANGQVVDHQFVSFLPVGADANGTLDTATLQRPAAGEYVVLDADLNALVFAGNGTVVDKIPRGEDFAPATFSLFAQTFGATAEDRRVAAGNETAVTLTSNRARYTVEVSAGGVADENISDVFPAANGTTIEVPTNEFDLRLRTGVLNGGRSYEFTFAVADTGETGTVSLTVGRSGTRNVSLPGAAGPAGDVDSDSLLEDVDGDGTANVFDAIALYNNRDARAVQSNARAFDFDGSGAVDVFDAVELYNEVA